MKPTTKNRFTMRRLSTIPAIKNEKDTKHRPLLAVFCAIARKSGRHSGATKRPQQENSLGIEANFWGRIDGRATIFTTASWTGRN